MPDAPRPLGTRHLVLLGLPGAGKSTVGPLVAAALGRPFVDLDADIEAREGVPVARLFAERGEAAFRALEQARSLELLAPGAPPRVVAVGGGWVESAANRALLGEAAAAVYLRVPADVALDRMGRSATLRPLLAMGDPASRMRELQARRESFYLQAEYTLSSELMPPELAASYIVALATGVRPD